MCGIVAYVGCREAVPILLDGLRRLEYRGYDSAGLTVAGAGGLATVKSSGRVAALEARLGGVSPAGGAGISHTRWATHGAPSDVNAHPHSDRSGQLALVHNGVIENYRELGRELVAKGHEFASETDSEVLAHRIGEIYEGLGELERGGVRLLESVRRGLAGIKGTYGIAVIHEDAPGHLVGARRGSPLVVGLAEGGRLLASDVAAIAPHTSEVIFLNDGDIVLLSAGDFEVRTLGGAVGSVEISEVDHLPDEVELSHYAHHMLKEIYEQPQAVASALRGRLHPEEGTAVLGGLQQTAAEVRAVRRVLLCGCGTAYHAAMVGARLVEELVRLPADALVASEFRYGNLPMERDSLVFALSQSGETIDTLAAAREAKRKGMRVLGIVNQVASSLARETDGGCYLHAGPEVGVAASKTFTSTVAVLALVALHLGRVHHLSQVEGQGLVEALEGLPRKLEEVLLVEGQVRAIAERYAGAAGFLFLGRLGSYPVALEGALKLKEISYLFASAHPSAELKHGVIALVDKRVPSVFVAPGEELLAKNLSSIQEVKARGGPVIAVTTASGELALREACDEVVVVPEMPGAMQSILSVVPLQFLSYHIAALRGCDIDKPRHLAKSVTVE
jgi:glutamine---fructose-6-phosphate transaminase (isomerizing)